MRHRFHAILFAVVLSLAFLASPADACGCGGYIPNGGNAYISQERALLRWDGKTEDIVMSLGVLGQSKDAAVILPVPSRAEMKLGDARVFDELAEFTKPQVREERVPSRLTLGAGAAPEGAAVTVLERKQLGPFDVSNLAATDTNALGEWLKANGYYDNFSPGLAKALQPYADQGWNFIAVRIQPGTSTDSLKGNLDPLWATFATNKLVYPMRASANASNWQSVTVYVLADHRVQKNTSFGASNVTFAGWVEPTALQASPVLKSFVTRKWFLTKFEDTVNPKQVNDDFYFTQAPNDDAYRAVRVVQVEDPNLLWLNLAAIFFVLICLPVLFAIGIIVLVIFLIRRRDKAHAQAV
ncbi:MAG: DUF2330 domain-containing protein [Chloroflexi bacterium]|nr:DUF2330 domain-containing protein [Chloroflexota bacterium]